MIGTSVFKLDGGDIDDALSGPLRDHMDETQEILTGVSEAHPPAGACLVVAGTSAHVKGDHALILVPDIDHAVQFVTA